MPAIKISRVDRTYVHFSLDAQTYDGQPVTLTNVDVVGLQPNSEPAGNTTGWKPAIVTGSDCKILVTGPDATADSNGIVIPDTGLDLWARVTDVPEVQAQLLGRVALR